MTSFDRFRRKQTIFTILYFAAAVTAMWGLQRTVGTMVDRVAVVPYTELLKLVRSDKVSAADIRDTEIVALLKDEREHGARIVVARRLPRVDDSPLVSDLEKHGVTLSGKIERPSWWQEVLAGWVVPPLIMMSLYAFGMRRLGRAAGPLTIGSRKARIYDESGEERVTFGDVAGAEEAKAELMEIVDFLRQPAKYQSLGARIPKGVLLVGPPGTGKTLLAKAVAGEAAVPFFPLSGSEFVEMFVGLGAARMRELFEQAKGRAPCIVFIDELDAIGKSRGGLKALATNDEREQTLNQLLVEMDGFDGSKGVIIMAATNRPEVLDPALLRAGRFDRQVLVDKPDLAGREEILKVHARKVRLGAHVDLHLVAQRTPGMVGADLANLINEAALAAARRGGSEVAQRDLDEALDRLQLGLKKKGRVMTDDEKRRVAYHEAGHTLVAMSLSHSDPVHRVTIIPRSIGALGATLQLPTDERNLLSKEELDDRICVMLGGRAAEEVAFGSPSTGAANDLERATETARRMVCRYGMSANLGPRVFGVSRQLAFMGESLEDDRQDYSDDTARAIDAEVGAIVALQHRRALEILQRRRATLERLVARLVAKETVERDELDELVRKADDSRAGGAPQASVTVAA